MAGTYFCFSDECGDYKPIMTDTQIRSHPFFIRTTLLMNSSEWKFLNNEFRALKNKYSLPLNKELKWANLWSLKYYKTHNQTIPEKNAIKYLENFEYQLLVDFIGETLALLSQLNEKIIIATFTNNSFRFSTNEKAMLSFHLQEHIQRIEMELQSDENNLGVLFFDPVSEEKNELFRQVYYDLFENGDFIKKYRSIKDSLNIENSHQSVGIQISDFISGSFSSFLKSSVKNNYSDGVKLFCKFIYPNIRRDKSGKLEGYGIREVPRNQTIREWLTEKLSSCCKI